MLILSGNMISDIMGILEEWVEFFDELFNNQNIGELDVPATEDDGQIMPSTSMKETVSAIHRLKSHKSQGADRISYMNSEISRNAAMLEVLRC